MKIYGIDFTSAPSRQKPISGVAAELTGETTLQIERPLIIASLNEFEVFLKRRGPWVGGFDFPFGQPRKLLENSGWPVDWTDFIELVARMSQQEFEEQLEAYRQPRAAGDKQHLRLIDAKAKACSPMMLYGVPVGKMFFKGAPRLLRAGLNILPCCPTNDNRIALEAYPALVARKWLDKRSYKNDDLRKQTDDQKQCRRDLLEGLLSTQFQATYGFRLVLSDALKNELIDDPMADGLDALLCAIQAAWAYTQRERGYGIPATCDTLEGWIVDPDMN